MPTFAICDDCVDDLEKLSNLLKHELEETELTMGSRVETFSSGEELLKRVESDDCFDVYFIDILMEELSGIETAAQLNHLSKKHFDLIVTTYSSEFALEAFDVRAVDYLIKPIDISKLRRALDRCRIVSGQPEYITITKNQHDYHVIKDEIQYIESFAHVCVFHTDDAEINTYMSMNAVLQLLNDDAFIRCHKSFIVNMNCVDSIDSKWISLKNGTTIPVGRTKQKEIFSAYDDFLIHKV